MEVRIRRVTGVALLALQACGLPRLADYAPHRTPERRLALYVAAGLAGRNNPNRPTGDEDNLTLAGGARIPLLDYACSLRPELHGGDHSMMATPSLTHDFAIAGAGPGAIDGNVGIGYTWHEERANNVLGNTESAFVRLGAEGSLVGDVLVGAALYVAPWGYDREDVAVAGVVYFGVRL